MFSNSVIHKILSEFLQPFRYVGMTRVAPYLLVIIIFYLVLGFWLVYSATLSDVSEEYGSLRTCLSTRLWDGDPSHTGLPVLVYPHFRLTRLLEGDLNDQSPLKTSWVVK